MSIFDKYKAIRTTCNYPFSSLREVIADLERNGRRNGFTNPVAQIIINTTGEKDTYDVQVVVCYKKSDDQFEQLKKSIRVFSFTDLPLEVNALLQAKKEAKLTFTQSDVEELILNCRLPIQDGGKSTLSSLLNACLSNTSHTANEPLQLVIRDYILYKRIVINIRDISGKDTYLTEFLTNEINGIPEEEAKKLSLNHEIALLIKH